MQKDMYNLKEMKNQVANSLEPTYETYIKP